MRPLLAWMLVKYSGLTHRQAAATLGMQSGVSAGPQVRKPLTLEEGDRKTKKTAIFKDDAAKYPLAGRGAVRVFIALALAFLVVSHIASRPGLLPGWAQCSLLAALYTFAAAGTLMFGRLDSPKGFLFNTALYGAWTLVIFAAVGASNPFLLYLALIPLLSRIVSVGVASRGAGSAAPAALLSLCASAWLLLTFLRHGPFDDLARVGRLAAVRWYLDARLLLTAILVVFIFCRAFLLAFAAPRKRLIRELALRLPLPGKGGLLRTAARALIDAVNDLLLRRFNRWTNAATWLLSVALCHGAATALEIWNMVRRQVLKGGIYLIVLRRAGVFAALLLIGLAMPALMAGVIGFIRGAGLLGGIGYPAAVMALALGMLALVQLLLPVEAGQFIRRAGRAVFFLACALFSAKTGAIILSFVPRFGFAYARNFDALYLAMLACMATAALIAFGHGDKSGTQQAASAPPKRINPG